MAYSLPLQLNLLGLCTRVLTRQGIQQFTLTIARDASNAHHLTGTNLQTDLRQIDAELVFFGQRQILHFKQHSAWLSVLVSKGWWFCANHQATERRIGFFTGIADTRHLAGSKHRTGCAQFSDFMQFVADVEQATALADQFLKHHKQLVHRLGRQNRGGLIQDQQLRLGEQGPNDFNPLHFAHA